MLLFASFDLSRRFQKQKFEIIPHHRVGNGHNLPVHIGCRIVKGDVIAEAFGHFLYAVQSDQQRHAEDALFRLPEDFLELPPHAQVEKLIHASEFNVRFQFNRVVRL